MRGEHGEYQRQYHTLGNAARRFSNPDVEAMAKIHAADAERQRGKYPPQHAATLVSANCSRQQVMYLYVCVRCHENMLNMTWHAVPEKEVLS